MNVEVLTQPFIDLWASFVEGLALLVPALIIFAIGLFVAKVVYKALVKVFSASKVDDLVKPFAGSFERAGYQLRIGHVIGWLAKWFIIIASLMIALDMVGLDSTRGLLTGIIAYIPQVIIAVLVLFAGFLLADFVKKLIKGSTKMLNFRSAAMLGNIARIAILVFTVLIVLNLLGIGRDIINILLIGFVSMIALAGGLAFGLGGRDAAARAIENAKHALHK
ncbi:hypothetical protein KC929_01330 [Patescibacteria group bacterium]|nr:hypothetical protein [Patescibacteria group bacterium]